MSTLLRLLWACLLFSVQVSWSNASEKAPFQLIVMDPLAAPLSCPCVEGYAQRRYQVLAQHLQEKLNRPVNLTFAEALSAGLKETKGKADLIIGKDSVVHADAAEQNLKMARIAGLTGKDGITTQHGLIVVNHDDPAKTVADLDSYKIIFGPDECDEKHRAALDLLKAHNVAIPKTLVIDQACSDGAAKVVELGPNAKVAAVISSYAAPLLEGCGTIQKGDLRVVGKTKPVPFVTAFISKDVNPGEQAIVTAALLNAHQSPELLEALESLVGFLPVTDETADAKKKEQDIVCQPVWPGWRGDKRDGHTPWLPAAFAAQPDILWEVSLARSGLGGIAATDDVVIFGDRDFEDFHDVYRCLDAQTGETRWEVSQLAINALDYGSSPRATPLIHNDLVYLFGASGDLLCVSLADGEIQWQLNVKSKFEARGELPWGYCGSPLIVDDKLIVTPGAADASVVALNLTTGEVVWKTPGGSASYGSLISGRFGGRHQVVGHDADTLGGWDVATGERLWSVKPEVGSDFNVPTPINLGGKLFVTTEGNGSRLFDFHTNGTINPIPVARNTRLHSNMSSAVVVKNSLYCVDRFLYCLDLQNGLQEKWRLRDPALGDYAAIIASPEYLLTIGSGELLLLKANGEPEIVSRLRIFPDTTPIYSHPAIVGKLLYIRGENTLKCINLDLRTPARSLRATPIDQVSESCVNE